jgi:hypothetical protein
MQRSHARPDVPWEPRLAAWVGRLPGGVCKRSMPAHLVSIVVVAVAAVVAVVGADTSSPGPYASFSKRGPILTQPAAVMAEATNYASAIRSVPEGKWEVVVSNPPPANAAATAAFTEAVNSTGWSYLRVQGSKGPAGQVCGWAWAWRAVGLSP